MDCSPRRSLLDARELRYRRRLACALAHPRRTLVELSMNVPGWPKGGPAFATVIERALAEWRRLAGGAVIHAGEDAAGHCALATVGADLHRAKRWGVDLESRASWGRLLDIDCYFQGRKISREELGLPSRRCLLCGEPHWRCIGAARHQPSALRARAEQLAAEA